MIPLITRLDKPTDIIADDLIKEYCGFDPDLDLSQDRALQVLKRAVVEQGEEHTGIVWAQANYRAEFTRELLFCLGLVLPLSPALSVSKIVIEDRQGDETEISAEDYQFIPSAIDLGRPWAVVRIDPAVMSGVVSASVEFAAGWKEDDLPESLRAWVLVRIATLYDYREDLVTGTTTAALPRDHTRSMLDLWTVRSSPYA